MPSDVRLGFISRERFDSLPIDDKLGVIFDFLVVQKEEQVSRCAGCVNEFDQRYEKKRSAWYSYALFAWVALWSMIGGFFANVLDLEPWIGK
jgi:hypothetical protein